MKPILIYCYDAYCGWCYGFSQNITAIKNQYSKQLDFEVLSGGMILPEAPVHIAQTAAYIQTAYKTVEDYTGVKFGEDYLWHIFNPQQSDWFPDSLKPAIALCIFKEFYIDKQIEFAADLQYALHFEGRDLTDDEAYRHLLEKYEIDADNFYTKLKSETYKEKAQYEFALCKQLNVTGFPCVFIQTSESKFHLIARGYTHISDLQNRIESVLMLLDSVN